MFKLPPKPSPTNRFSFKPRYVIPARKRLPMEKTVTIAAGILCTDGMVVCADTEHSISDDRKSQGSKLRVWQSVYRKDDDDESDTRMSIAFAGAGHSDWISAYIQGIDDDELTDVPNDFDL